MAQTYNDTYLYLMDNFTKVQSRWPKQAGERHREATIKYVVPIRLEPHIDKIKALAISKCAAERNKFVRDRALTPEEKTLMMKRVLEILRSNDELVVEAIMPGFFLAIPEMDRFN